MVEKKSWISFVFLTVSQTGKTKIWEVFTKDEPVIALGAIKWFGRWRRYAFYPEKDTVFEHDCLRDIASFCEAETKLHNRKAA